MFIVGNNTKKEEIVLSVGDDVIIALIRQYIRLGKYAFKFEKEKIEDKTSRFMKEKSLTPKALLEPILELKSCDQYKPRQEGRGKYDYGNVYFYKKPYFDENLYIKILMPKEISNNILILSVHKYGEYDND